MCAQFSIINRICWQRDDIVFILYLNFYSRGSIYDRLQTMLVPSWTFNHVKFVWNLQCCNHQFCFNSLHALKVNPHETTCVQCWTVMYCYLFVWQNRLPPERYKLWCLLVVQALLLCQEFPDFLITSWRHQQNYNHWKTHKIHYCH